MSTELPIDFKKRMKEMLGDEYDEFIASYDTPNVRALRINECKKFDVKRILDAFSLTPVSWCDAGYYFTEDDTPGKHPYHEAGAYYIQEPSAMVPVEYLMSDVCDMSCERILDLCAAPGGKSTQIASHMKGRGLLVSNEINEKRASVLSENIERMGITNAIVTNVSPDGLSDRFAGYFTRILVDAPCSGEGMFKKNAQALPEWSIENTLNCAARQDEILECAAKMLCAGGKLVYSTCTFAPIENERTISHFLDTHPEFSVEMVPLYEGMSRGKAEWAEDIQLQSVNYTIRIWPHKAHGEGHYIAVLRKDGVRNPSDIKADGTYDSQVFEEFKETALKGRGIELVTDGKYLRFGDQLYILPEFAPDIKGIRVLRPGLHLGTLKKNRFEPSHALALALDAESVVNHVDLPLEEGGGIYRFINGESIALPEENRGRGWCLVTVDGMSVGWGKISNGIIKNHYPKGLRKNLS